MKVLILGVLLAMLTSSTQSERTYEVRVRGNWNSCSKTETYYIKSRNRAMAEEEAHMQMTWRIKVKTVSIREKR